jgi:molecular chaperone GrpE
MNDGLPTGWRQTRELLTDLLTWLDETRQWVETATAGEAWYDETVSPVAPSDDAPAAEIIPITPVSTPLPEDVAEPEADVANPDLFALLASLTALRQEIKLQTRSARHDREQAAQSLDQLAGALTQLERHSQEADSQHQDAIQEAARAAADTLVELHDAMSRTARQASHILDSAVATLRAWSAASEEQDISAAREEQRADAASDTANGQSEVVAVGADVGPGVIGRIRGWLGRPRRRATGQEVLLLSGPDPGERLCHITSQAAHLADRLAGLDVGYTLSIRRLERALVACGIEPIECIGQPVDAELMEVVQIVSDATQPSGMVIDEVRRGYRRYGQIYRFAQVVATRSTPQEDSEPAVDEMEGEPG